MIAFAPADDDDEEPVDEIDWPDGKCDPDFDFFGPILWP